MEPVRGTALRHGPRTNCLSLAIFGADDDADGDDVDDDGVDACDMPKTNLTCTFLAPSLQSKQNNAQHPPKYYDTTTRTTLWLGSLSWKHFGGMKCAAKYCISGQE